MKRSLKMKALINDGFTPPSTCAIAGWAGAVAIGGGSIAGAAISGSASQNAAEDQENAALSAQQIQQQEQAQHHGQHRIEAFWHVVLLGKGIRDESSAGGPACVSLQFDLQGL